MSEPVASENQSECEETLKGLLPDSHEIATETVPVYKPSQVRWRGQKLAD